MSSNWFRDRFAYAAEGVRSHLGFFVVQLIVVFLGVYMAALVTGRQEDSRERELALKYREMLSCDFAALVDFLKNEEQKLEQHLQVVEEIDEGLQPNLPVGEFYFPHDDQVVQAVFDSKNFESMDSNLVRNIVTGRFMLESVEQRVERLNEFMTTVLQQMAVSGDRRYYDEEGRLLQHLEPYPRLIRGTIAWNRNLQQALVEGALPSLFQERMEMVGTNVEDLESAELRRLAVETACQRSASVLLKP